MVDHGTKEILNWRLEPLETAAGIMWYRKQRNSRTSGHQGDFLRGKRVGTFFFIGLLDFFLC